MNQSARGRSRKSQVQVLHSPVLIRHEGAPPPPLWRTDQTAFNHERFVIVADDAVRCGTIQRGGRAGALEDICTTAPYLGFVLSAEESERTPRLWELSDATATKPVFGAGTLNCEKDCQAGHAHAQATRDPVSRTIAASSPSPDKAMVGIFFGEAGERVW